jgi:hypothetical protein
MRVAPIIILGVAGSLKRIKDKTSVITILALSMAATYEQVHLS